MLDRQELLQDEDYKMATQLPNEILSKDFCSYGGKAP